MACKPVTMTDHGEVRIFGTWIYDITKEPIDVRLMLLEPTVIIPDSDVSGDKENTENDQR